MLAYHHVPICPHMKNGVKTSDATDSLLSLTGLDTGC
jgi:hypothetical protein